jgi:flagellin-like hook-associated protein FlgL
VRYRSSSLDADFILDPGTGSAENTLDAAAVNLSEAIELVEDADIAMESALLARHQLLADNAATALIIVGIQSRTFLQMLQQIAFS